MRTPKQFQSTPSARRATGSASRPHSQYPISIHALREEGDVNEPQFIADFLVFQSTPSARRATNGKRAAIPRYFISIHALREEGDG